MSLVFAWRATTISAYYAPGGEVPRTFSQGQTTLAAIVDCSFTGAIGGKALDMNNAAVNSFVQWGGALNTPNTATMTIVYRFAKATAGTASINDNIFQFGGDTGNYYGLHSLQHQNGTDNFTYIMRNEFGQAGGTIDFGNYTFTTNDFRDLVITNPGTTTVNYEMFVDGATLGSGTFSRSLNFSNGNYLYSPITLGRYLTSQQSVHYVNEILIFDHVLSASSITSVFTGSSRLNFYSTTVNQPTNSTDPGESNVVGVSYTFKGDSLTGSYSTPTYTDPGVGNVRLNTNYVFNDSTLTGTLNVPTASTGTANTVPLNEIKEQIRYALFVNNTSTGAPTQNLSENMSRPVGQILKINPEKIPMSSNIMPCVTVFIDSKETSPNTINRDGLNGKRRAEVNLKVVGIVDEPYTTDLKEDPADEDLEILMENIERVLRGYDSLSNNVRWQFPTAVSYHSAGWDEQAHYRAAIMDIKATVDY